MAASKADSVRKALFLDGNNEHSLFLNHSSSKNNNAPRIGTLLIVLLGCAVFFKYSHVISGKPAATLLNEMSTEVLTKATISSVWLKQNYTAIAGPLVCGLLVTLFTWAMVYIDSDVPGENPPSPFSPRKHNRRISSSYQKTCHLSYFISAASGLTVCCLLFLF